ncbi:hypothetical protein MXB_3604, partial [Myxobolus squamalis]
MGSFFSYYNWAIAGPMIVSYVAFNSFLPKDTLIQLKRNYLPRRRMGWFNWRRNIDKEFTDDEEIKKMDTLNPKLIDGMQEKIAEINDAIEISTTPYETINEEDFCQSPDENVLDYPKSPDISSEKCLRRSKILSSTILKTLNLKPGENEVIYSVTTRYQGTVTCVAKIFLWHHTDRIVISDVDGTITKSDVLGMMLPLVGKDWTQDGVVKLFTLIHNNGYKIIYLSARTIGIANRTRIYLENVIMEELKLPRGPILLSPSSLFESLHREVIEKKPEIFKIECLSTIANLYPTDLHPL